VQRLKQERVLSQGGFAFTIVEQSNQVRGAALLCVKLNGLCMGLIQYDLN